MQTIVEQSASAAEAGSIRTAQAQGGVVRVHRCCRGMWSKRRCKNKAQWQSSVTISRKHGGKKVQTFWCYAHKGEDDVPLRPNADISHSARQKEKDHE